MNKTITINLREKEIIFNLIPIELIENDIENTWKSSYKKSLKAYLDNAIDIQELREKSHPLKATAPQLKEKYYDFLNYSLYDFLSHLKNSKNNDLSLFLNKYGGKKFCRYRINEFLKDNGIYCYVLNDKIMYLGRCLKTFNERLNLDYGKITPYNCLINGQATNCHINSLVNKFSNIGDLKIGVYKMTGKSKTEITLLEKEIFQAMSFPWNIQKS